MVSQNTPIREPDQIRQDCARKLRAVKVGDHFHAILGCLLGEDWTYGYRDVRVEKRGLVEVHPVNGTKTPSSLHCTHIIIWPSTALRSG